MRREKQKYQIEWNHETWVEAVILPIREGDPASSQVDLSLLKVGQDREHVGMPLSKFMNPTWDARETWHVHHDVVKLFLQKRERSYLVKGEQIDK